MNDKKEVDFLITEDEIRLKLGCSTVVMGPQRFGAREIAKIRESGITRIEIGGYYSCPHYNYRDKSQLSEIIAECRMLGVSIVSVHGPGIGFVYDTPFSSLRDAIVGEVIFAVRVAEELGAGLFITHFGMHGIDVYTEKSVSAVLEQTADTKVKIMIENGTDLKPFAEFVARFASERLGIVLDIGHARDSDGGNPFLRKGGARRVVSECEKALSHLHLHDFADADHYPPFDGKVRWGELLSALSEASYGGELLFEAQCKTSPEDTLQKIARFPREFCSRYL